MSLTHIFSLVPDEFKFAIFLPKVFIKVVYVLVCFKTLTGFKTVLFIFHTSNTKINICFLCCSACIYLNLYEM